MDHSEAIADTHGPRHAVQQPTRPSAWDDGFAVQNKSTGRSPGEAAVYGRSPWEQGLLLPFP